MPYIKQFDRNAFDENIIKIVEMIESPGELCYCIYSLMKRLSDEDLCFRTMSEIISEVECAKLEFYRKIVSPYEDKKIIENGDI